MSVKVKVNIEDNKEIRTQIELLYETMKDKELAKWSLAVAKHILPIAGIDYLSIDKIVDGFKTNERWQENQASPHEVRQASFRLHKMARESHTEIKKTALRVAGHAVASGHMKEHAMVASDYAIKTINLIYLNDSHAVTRERQWQLKALENLM